MIGQLSVDGSQVSRTKGSVLKSSVAAGYLCEFVWPTCSSPDPHPFSDAVEQCVKRQGSRRIQDVPLSETLTVERLPFKRHERRLLSGFLTREQEEDAADACRDREKLVFVMST